MESDASPTSGAERNRATAVGAIAVLLWAGLASLTAATGALPPFELSALCFAIGGSAGLAVSAVRGRLGALRQGPAVWALGVGGLFGYHALYFAALRLAPPAQASLVAYLWPLLIVLLSAFLPGERLRFGQVLGALLGFAGVGVLATVDQAGGVPQARFLPGYGLGFVAAFVWAGYSVLSRRFAAVPTEAVAGFCLATAGLAGLAHAAFERTALPASPLAIAAVLALGLGPVGLAFFVWDHGVKRGDIRTLGILSYAAPVLSTLLIVATGFAKPSTALGVACVLIAGGALVATVGGSRSPRHSGA